MDNCHSYFEVSEDAFITACARLDERGEFALVRRQLEEADRLWATEHPRRAKVVGWLEGWFGARWAGGWICRGREEQKQPVVDAFRAKLDQELTDLEGWGTNRSAPRRLRHAYACD